MRSQLNGLSILVVDDDADSRDLTAFILGREGATTFLADDAAEARMALERERIDLVLTDLSLPDEDGYALLAWMRASETCCDVPVIAISGRSARSEREKTTAAGFAKHLVKPADIVDLVNAVSSVAAPSPEASCPSGAVMRGCRSMSEET